MSSIKQFTVGNESHSFIDANFYSLIEDLYDNTKTYAVGDYSIYDYKLYKCNTAISTPESFDINKWDLTNITDELKR